MTTPKLFASTVGPLQINEIDRARMYLIMQKYYDSLSRANFYRDLDQKHAVIILRDENAIVQGFSTLLKRKLIRDQKEIIGLFSGDTIIEKAFWGQTALGKEFLRYLWKEKITNPFTPVYWFLISKGYKTYLLMANNFKEYYPRFDAMTPPATQNLMNEFYSELYPKKYDPETGRILFEVCEGKLKSGVADTSLSLTETNPKVAHFEKLNPGWSKGDELACIARMTFLMPFQYQLKVFLKKFKKRNKISYRYAGAERRIRQVLIENDRRKREFG